MIKSLKLFTPFLILLACLPLKAQEQLGVYTGKFAGINSVRFNPAATVNSPLQWDINLVNIGVFEENNYAFFQNTSLFNLLRNTGDIQVATEVNPDEPLPQNTILLDFFDNTDRKYLYVNSSVMGPSALFRVKDHTFGIYFQGRTVAAANRIESTLGYYNFLRQDFGNSFVAAPFKIAGMSWSEIALNYGRKVKDYHGNELAAGATVKYLQGYDAFFFNNNTGVSLTRQQGDMLDFETANVTYGLATNYNEEENTYQFSKNGNGLAIDLGATYTIYGYDDDEYKLKVGASLVDLGKISFKQNAEKHEVTVDEAFTIDFNELENVDNSDELFEFVSQQALGDAAASQTGTQFSVWLPAAISLQADLALTKTLFVNATAVRRIRLNGAAVERSNILSLTPRFETRWFAAFVPITLFNDRDLRMGAALRLGPLTVGSDNILSMIQTQSTFTGSDVYVALKINPVDLNRNKSACNKKRKMRTNQKGCYTF